MDANKTCSQPVYYE